MTQKEKILQFFRAHGNSVTLGQFLQHPFGYKCTSRISDLRKEGYTILCEVTKPSTNNRYTLIEFDESGQGRFA